jgi:vesicle transport through interaction with t-SNAREs 1
LEQLGLEINQNVNADNRKSQQMRLNSYKAELKRLEEEYNKSKIKPNPLLSALNDDSSLDDFDIGLAEDQKRRLLDNSDTLERTGNQLTDAYRLAIETEEVGTGKTNKFVPRSINISYSFFVGILSNLSQQRDQIRKSRSRLRDTNADLGRSNRLMNMMIVRSIRDKFVLYIIGVAFVLAIVLAIYFSLRT